LQTESPYWLEEAYTNPIVSADTGILERNNKLARNAAVLIYFLYNRHGRFVDFAGGYGIFTRLMRDIGFDYYWCDAYAKNIFAQGFEYQETQNPIELVTAFECFEHFANPLVELEKMLAITPNILCTTDLLPSPIPSPDVWWYYALSTGQHISFYSTKTFLYLAQKYNLFFYSCPQRGIHLLTRKKIPYGVFRMLVEYGQSTPFAWVKKHMKSKTFFDMNLICNNDYKQ
jgi:hypothetical protein